MSNANEPAEIQKSAPDLAGQYLLNDFQNEVIRAIRNYRKLTTEPSARRIWRGKGHPPRTRRRKLPQAEEMERQAEKLTARPDIRKYLCPALKSASNDVFEIGKVITPILLALVFAGEISIPAQPLFFAAIAFIVAKGGITSICDEYAPQEKTVKKPRKTVTSKRKPKK